MPLCCLLLVPSRLRFAILAFDNSSASINACVFVETFLFFPAEAISILGATSGSASALQCAATMFSTIDSSGVRDLSLKR